jgi:steroid delta-isomerase-like uncharacterized protein
MSPDLRQHAIAVVQSYYDAFNQRDWERMLSYLHDDVVHDLNQGAREIGRALFASFLQRMHASYSEQLHDIVLLANEDGSRVAAEYVVHGQYHHADEGLPPAHGQTYVLPGGAFFAVDDARITRVSNYYNLQDWIRQVSG